MNREIKFRAWDGEKIIHHIPNSAVSTGSFLEFMGTALQIMQYTGLKDKNGKEIYEGDTLSFREENAFVEWYPLSVRFGIFFPTWGHYFDDEKFLKDQIDELEIIGNIYENPELLNPNE